MSTIERHNDSNADWPTAFLAYLRFIGADLASKTMVGMQKLLRHAFSIQGARAPAATTEYAHSNTSTIQLRKGLLDTEENRVRGHYSSLGEILEAIAKQKFNNVLSEVILLVSYLEAAEVYTASNDELLDETSVCRLRKHNVGRCSTNCHLPSSIYLDSGSLWRVWQRQATIRGTLRQDGEISGDCAHALQSVRSLWTW